jgi:hypothetical protein
MHVTVASDDGEEPPPVLDAATAFVPLEVALVLGVADINAGLGEAR